MSDDLTPPPVPPMDEDARARVRARLAEATAASGPAEEWRRWLVPVAAAVAVLVVAVGAGALAFWPGGDDTAAPASGQTTATPTPTPAPTLTLTPTLTATEETTAPTSPSTSVEPPPPAVTEAGACGEAVRGQLERGAEQVASWQLPNGGAGIWVAGDRSVLCEDSGGIATVHRAAPTDAAPLSEERLIWSTSTYGRAGGLFRTAFVAGGLLPEGVTGIDYAWPDGDVERARIVDDGVRRWWLVAHVPQDGVLVEPGTNFLRLDDVHVTVSLSGAQQSFDLPFATSMCAQVNHGC